jgi:hypothetical protein
VLKEQRPSIVVGLRDKMVEKLLKFKLMLVLKEERPTPALLLIRILLKPVFIVHRVLIVVWPIVVLRVDRPLMVIFERDARLVLKEEVPTAVLL